MTITDRLFGQEEKIFGHVYNHRYHMPLLPGETGVKSGGDWVPHGLTRTTNLCGAIVETRALSIWEQEQALIGMVLDPTLYEELAVKVHRWVSEGVDFSRIRDFPEVRLALTGFPKHEDQSIIGRAKHAAGANQARQAGIVRHEAWEHRSKLGELIGTAEMQAQMLAVEALLADAGLQIIPSLSERTIRNTMVNCAGRFDNVLLEMHTGRLLMADLKTKRRKFYSWLEIDAQLATYAKAEWMITEDARGYEEGPAEYVDQTEGVVLHMPSNGETPYLRRADLVRGWRIAQLARQVMDERAQSKNVERHALSHWIPAQNRSER